MATSEQISALSVPFPREALSTVNKRGSNLTYLEHSRVVQRLLEVDPDWHIEIMTDASGRPVYEKCDLSGTPTGAWFNLTIGGVTKTVFGSYDPPVAKATKDGLQDGTIKWSPLMDPDAPKKILSDAISTGAARWGVGIDLWMKTSDTKSVEDQRAKRLLAIKNKIDSGGEALKKAVANYMNGRKSSDLDENGINGLEALLECFNVKHSAYVVEFLVKHSMLTPLEREAVAARLLEMNVHSANDVSDEHVKILEQEGLV